jgi:hypothetical protein
MIHGNKDTPLATYLGGYMPEGGAIPSDCTSEESIYTTFKPALLNPNHDKPMTYFSEEQKDTYVRLRFRAILESSQEKRELPEFMADPQSEEVKERPISI